MSPCLFTSWLRQPLRDFALSFLLAFLAASVPPCLAPAQSPSAAWVSQGTLAIPSQSYSFLAATPDGHLLAATFNSSPEPRDLPVVLITNPSGFSPKLLEVTRVPFAGQRGYSGLACEADGSFFIAGDTGEESTSFIRKFRRDGTPDTSFGTGGEIRPGRRCLGIDVVGDYLLIALNWGRLGVIKSKTGQILGSLPSTGPDFFLRDIAVEPGTMDIFGVSEGDVQLWSGGTPWNPVGYQRRKIFEGEGTVRSGEGISIDPISRSALITPIPGNGLLQVASNGSMTPSTIQTATADSHLADSSLSFDGQTLFISDMRLNTIHVMKRVQDLGDSTVVAKAAAGGGHETRTAPTSNYRTKTKWWRSYLGVVEEARRYNTPMLVYFRSGGYPICEQFQNSVLLTPEFDSTTENGKKVVCVFEDVSADPLIAYRLGVYRVPHVEIFDSKGRSVGRFSGTIDKGQFYNTLQNVQ